MCRSLSQSQAQRWRPLDVSWSVFALLPRVRSGPVIHTPEGTVLQTERLSETSRPPTSQTRRNSDTTVWVVRTHHGAASFHGLGDPPGTAWSHADANGVYLGREGHVSSPAGPREMLRLLALGPDLKKQRPGGRTEELRGSGSERAEEQGVWRSPNIQDGSGTSLECRQ